MVPLGLPYCMSQSGVNQLTRAWALESVIYNIQMNAVATAYSITDMNRERLLKKDFKGKLLLRIPGGRLGKR